MNLMNEGWVCPKCGAVYAPWVSVCRRCLTPPKEEQIMFNGMNHRKGCCPDGTERMNGKGELVRN